MKILIKNAKTLKHLLGDEGNQEFVVKDILIENGIISNISDHIDDKVDQVLDINGYFLSPGLCDPQVHFREPGLEYKEDIQSGSKAAVKGGFTTVISMPNTAPTADNPDTISYMAKKSEEVGLCNVLPTGAVSIGLKGIELTDFENLKKAGAIALTDDGKGIQNDELFEKAMLLAKEVNLPLLDHSEDESLSNGGAIHLGEISKKFNVKGIDSYSEAAHVKRGCEVSLKTGAHYHVLHVSTKESLNYIKEAKDKGANVTVEVSPHHLLLCDEDIPLREENDLNPNWKMNPPLRSSIDRAACVDALRFGLIDAIATDHAPHAPHEKEKHISEAPFGIIGLETAFPLIFTNFVKTKMITLSQCIDLMSKNAGNLFGLDIGRIEVGKQADLAVFDLNHKFHVTQDYFHSRSKNSPFIGQELCGETKLTLYKGKIVFNNL